MKTEELEFENNGINYKALFHYHEEERPLLVYLAPSAGKSLSPKLEYLKKIAEKGVHVFRSDFCWQNSGNKNFSLRDCINDVKKFIEVAKQYTKVSKIHFYSKSFGGIVGFLYDGEIESMIHIDPYTWIGNKEDIRNIIDKSMSEYRMTDYVFKEDYLKNLKIPMLIFHGRNDNIIPVSNSEKLKNLLPNARLVKVEDGDHNLDRDEDHELIIKESVNFLGLE